MEKTKKELKKELNAVNKKYTAILNEWKKYVSTPLPKACVNCNKKGGK